MITFLTYLPHELSYSISFITVVSMMYDNPRKRREGCAVDLIYSVTKISFCSLVFSHKELINQRLL